MSIAISTHDQRVLIGGSVFIAVLVGGSHFGARALAWSADNRSSAASLVQEVNHEEESIRLLPSTRDSLVARAVRLASFDSAILASDSPALAAASLAELVSDVAQSTKTQLGGLQVRTDSAPHGTFASVQVQASISGDLPAVARFIERLEKGPPLLAVRELSLSGQFDQGPLGKREVIRAELLIEALAKTHPSLQGATP